MPTDSAKTPQHAHFWKISAAQTLSLDQPRIMGILNTTPDSFSDGGAFYDPGSAVEHALAMIEQGACIIDIGGESTRPGAERITIEEQHRRVLPVIKSLRKQSDVLISIDTTRTAVAAAAIDAGANIINDVSAGFEDSEMFSIAAQTNAGLILMHRLLPPDQDSFSDQYTAPPEYGDVVQTVRELLAERARAAEQAGVSRHAIVLDPGLGFGKTVQQNYELIRRTDELLQLGYPLLSAASRKSFLGAATGIKDPAARVSASVAVSVTHYQAGIRLFRVHDVAEHRQALAVAHALASLTA